MNNKEHKVHFDIETKEKKIIRGNQKIKKINRIPQLELDGDESVKIALSLS